MFRSLHMKLTLILLLLITSLMAVVGAFLTISVSGFFTDTFYEQINSVFGADQLEFVSSVRGEAAQANGAERILMPEEHDYDEAALVEDIMECKRRGKKNYIIINAEGIGGSIEMAERIEAATGMETRATIIGHMQRGGSPTCKDRVYASIMGAMAVDLLIEGKSNRVVGYKHGQYVDFDINEALGMQKGIPVYQYEIAKELAL